MWKEIHCRAISPQCVNRHASKISAWASTSHGPRGRGRCKLGQGEKKLKIAYTKSRLKQLVKILQGKELHYHHDHSEGQSHMLDCVQGLISLVLCFGSYLGRCIRGGVQRYLIYVQPHIMYSYTLSSICNGKIWATNPRPNMYVVYMITNELKLGFGSSCLNQR